MTRRSGGSGHFRRPRPPPSRRRAAIPWRRHDAGWRNGHVPRRSLERSRPTRQTRRRRRRTLQLAPSTRRSNADRTIALRASPTAPAEARPPRRRRRCREACPRCFVEEDLARELPARSAMTRSRRSLRAPRRGCPIPCHRSPTRSPQEAQGKHRRACNSWWKPRRHPGSWRSASVRAPKRQSRIQVTRGCLAGQDVRTDGAKANRSNRRSCRSRKGRPDSPRASRTAPNGC